MLEGDPSRPPVGLKPVNRTLWVINSVLVVSTVVSLFLLVFPFFTKLILAGRGYVDPEMWPPFGTSGLGLLLREFTIRYFFYGACIVPLLALLGIDLCLASWRGLSRTEKKIHSMALLASGLVALFLIISGPAIFMWLID